MILTLNTLNYNIYGIDMTWIFCYKEECEVLLMNSIFPIHNFYQNLLIIINHHNLLVNYYLGDKKS